MKIKTTYMSGAGNIFTVIDNRDYNLPVESYKTIATIVCRPNQLNKHRTEGLLVLNTGSEGADFNVDFFNPDGSHDAMCGNGGRCAVKYAIEKNYTKTNGPGNILFSMAGGLYHAEWDNEEPALYLPAPKTIREPMLLQTGGLLIRGAFVDVHSLHFVINIDDLPDIKASGLYHIDLIDFSHPIRYHDDFSPAGINVNLFELVNNNTINLRTYERGVEEETGACGTGAVSTAVIAVLRGLSSFPLTIIPPSKIPLIVDVKGSFPGNIEFMVLKGHAEITGEDVIELN